MSDQVRTAIVSWDWREQIDVDELFMALAAVSDGKLYAQDIDTGSDQFAVAISTGSLTQEQLKAEYDKWLREES